MSNRWTMMDAMFTMISGREETLLAMVAKLVVQYIMNLTIGRTVIRCKCCIHNTDAKWYCKYR
eukprot:1333652-Prorocentrum_lima.AAC.1